MAASSSSIPLLSSDRPSSKQLIFPYHSHPKLSPTLSPFSTFSSNFKLTVSSSSSPVTSTQRTTGETERIFFDGGAHYGDLVANLLLGFTLLWLPLTLAAVSRAFFLRYRFTDLRVTVVSGFTGQDRSDFAYKSIKDVQVVPRFIGEWGDIVITLTDGTKVDLRSVPRFREIAEYCLRMAEKGSSAREEGRAKGF